MTFLQAKRLLATHGRQRAHSSMGEDSAQWLAWSEACLAREAGCKNRVHPGSSRLDSC